MNHPRLSVSALSSFSWSFDEDLALWRELGVPRSRPAGGRVPLGEAEGYAPVIRRGVEKASAMLYELGL